MQLELTKKDKLLNSKGVLNHAGWAKDLILEYNRSDIKASKFRSSDGRFEMDFVPILDRYSNSNLLVIKSTQHQVFGRFSGKAILDDGTKIMIKDLLGFAEKVMNRW